MTTIMSPDREHDPRPICAQCGNTFEPRSETQAFCCTTCHNKYYYAHHGDMTAVYPKRKFICKNPRCSKLVITDGPGDMRTKFCSHACEKYYWRHCYNVSGKKRAVTQRYRNIGEAAKARAYQDHLFDEENAAEDALLESLGFDLSKLKEPKPETNHCY